MYTLNRLPFALLLASVIVLSNCSDDETTPEIQAAKLAGGHWEPGYVIHEIDGNIFKDRFADFQISFAGGYYNKPDKGYEVWNPGGEAFEHRGFKRYEFVYGNINRIERLDNGFQFDVELSKGDTELQITTGPYTFILRREE